MALSPCEDLPNETVKEMTCTNKMETINDILHHHREDHERIITTESSAERSLLHFTMETDIDKTAELLPSGRIKSHHNGIKRGVTETSPPQLITTPKFSDDLTEKQKSSSSPTYSQENSFTQQSRTKLVKKWIQSSLELPEGLLDKGKTEPQGDTIVDLYSPGTTPDFSESIIQRASMQKKSDDDDNDEDLYTDTSHCEVKHMSLTHIYTSTQINKMNKEIQSKKQMTDEILFKNKVWNVPSPDEIYRKLIGNKLESGIECKISDNEETGETHYETLMLKSTEPESQTNVSFHQHSVTSQNFLYDSSLYERNSTDDMKLKCFMEDCSIKQDLAIKHYVEDHIYKELKQCEDEAGTDETQKDEIDLKTVNNKNDQKLELESNTMMLFDKNTNIREEYDNFSGITRITKAQNPVAFVPEEGRSNENIDNHSPKTLTYDKDSQPFTLPNIPTCTSLEDKTSSLKDTDDQTQICRNNVVIDSINTHDDTNGGIKKEDSKAGKNVTHQLEFQKTRYRSTMCLANIDRKKSTSILEELSSSQSNEIKCISPGHDFISTGSPGNEKTMEESSKIFKKVENDSGINFLADEHQAKKIHLEGHQLPYFDIINQPILDDTLSRCTATISDSTNHSPANPLDPSNQSRGTVIEISFKNKTTCFPYDQIISVYHNSVDQGTDHSHDASTLCTKTSTDQSDHCQTIMSDSSYQKKFTPLQTSDQFSTMNSDSAIMCSSSSFSQSHQCLTNSSPNSTNQCKNISTDLSCHFSKTSTDLYNNHKNTVPNGSDQCTPSHLDSTNQWRNDSSDMSFSPDCSSLCTRTCMDQSNQCSDMNPDSAFMCSDSCLNPSDRSIICPDSSNQHKNNSPESSYHFPSISSKPFINCDHDAPDPSKQSMLSTLDSTYNWKEDSCNNSYSSGSSALCTASTSDPSHQCKTIIDQIKRDSLDISDKYTIMNLDSILQCSVTYVNPSNKCTPFVPKSTNQYKQFTLTSSDLCYQCPTIDQDSSYLDPPDRCTTNSSDVSYHCTTDLSDVSKECAMNYSDPSKPCTSTVQESPDQYRITCLDTLGQCTTMTFDPTCQFQVNSHENTVISSDCSYKYKTTSLNSSEENKTIPYDTSNNILPMTPEKFESNYQHIVSQTPSDHFITNSSGSCDLHRNDFFFSSSQTSSFETAVNNQCVRNTQYPLIVCGINMAESLPQFSTINSDRVLKALTSTSNISDHHDQRMDNCIEPSNQVLSSTAMSSHELGTVSSDASNHCITSNSYSHTISSPNSSQQISYSSPDPCTSTNNPDLPDESIDILGDPDLSCTTISVFPSCQHTATSIEHQCTNISVDFQLFLHCENNTECGPLKEPTEDEYGSMIKQKECSFLEVVRNIFLDKQGVGLSLLDSGIILTKQVNYSETLVLMMLRDGKELGTVIRSSKLFLYYQLEKHFYVIQQLEEDLYYAQDRITKVTMLMKKVPLTNNWLKTLYNFLCLPKDPNLLTPYAVVTDRKGSILFLMEDRDMLGVGTPSLEYVLNTIQNLDKVLHFMRYCWKHRVLTRKITTSIIYTPQGICFDPTSLCNNDDLCEFKKCLKECLLVFLFDGQQEEFDWFMELLLERAQLLLEEEWSPHISLARLLTAPFPGALPFCFPFFLNEN